MNPSRHSLAFTGRANDVEHHFSIKINNKARTKIDTIGALYIIKHALRNLFNFISFVVLFFFIFRI